MSTIGEITIQAALHRSGRWVIVPLLVGGLRPLSAVLDTGSPVSAISPRTERVLLGDGLLQSASCPNRYGLVSLTAQGQYVPDMEVGVIRRLDRLDVEALIGLDFLMQFASIHFDTRALQLRLVRD